MTEFRSLTQDELSSVQPSTQEGNADDYFGGVSSKNPPNTGVKFRTLDAPQNTVFDQDNNRVVGLPQTLDENETAFVIKRDVDEVKDFFAMEEVGGFRALGRGLGEFFLGGIPQAGLTLGKQQAELAAARENKSVTFTEAVDNPLVYLGRVKDSIIRNIGTDDIIQKMDALTERNKKYIADSGWERPEQNGFLYDVGSGLGSLLTSLGIYGLTRSPAMAAPFLGAMQKADTYKEAMAAQEARGETPDPISASEIASIDAMVNIGLEYVGLDRFIKALRGNSFVKRFVNGGMVEFIQEGSQGAANEIITQTSGIRDKSLAETAQSILYQAAIGFIVGAPSNAAIGAFTEKTAVENGIDPPTASKMGSYVEKNVDMVKTNLSEFIDKELAPIAADEKSAQEFITLMQKFGNNEQVVDRESLSVEDKKVFDEYVEMFNNSGVDRVGINEVEKTFMDQALEAGVDQEQAQEASRLVGARADAASRALGVSPMEWYKAKNIKFGKGVEDAVAQADVDVTEARQIKESLSKQRSVRNFNRNDPRAVQRKLGLSEKPKSVLQFIESLGGIITSKKEGEVKGKDAQGELKRIFDGNKKSQLKRYLSQQKSDGKQTGKSIDVIHQALIEAGYIERMADAYQFQDQSNADAVYDLIEREVNGGRIYPVNIENELNASEDVTTKNFDYLAMIGIDESMTEEEIAAQLKAYRKDIADYEASLPKEQNNFIDDEILFQDPSAYDKKGKAKTSSKAFKKWFGKSKVVDEDGKPLVVYHGTAAKMEDSFYFDPKMIGSQGAAEGYGFYFTTDETTASGYNPRGQGTTAAVYLSLQKPMDVNHPKFDLNTTKKIIKRVVDDEINKYPDETPNYKDSFLSNFVDTYSMSEISAISEVAKMIYNGNELAIDQIAEIGNTAGNKIAAHKAVMEVTGFDGIKSDGYAGKGEAGGTIYVAWLPEQIKSVNNKGTFDKNNPNIFNQGEDKNPRGSVTFGKNEIIINLFEGANPSTLLHELGHIFLRDMRDIAAVTKRPRVKADYEAVKKWLGAKGDTFTVAQEEKFARGFEAYLREGKAPKPELQGAFDKFKKWLSSVYNSVKQLNVNISPEIRDVFDRMLGADYAISETLRQQAAERDMEADYEAVARVPEQDTLSQDTRKIFKSIGDLSSDAFSPISTRLGHVHQKLKHAVRRYAFNTGFYTHQDRTVLKPFIEKVSKTFTPEDYRILNMALMNRDVVKIDFLMDKYGTQEEFKPVSDILDNIFKEANEVGMDVGYIEGYWPRKVKRDKVIEYMNALRKSQYWTEIELGLREIDPNGVFTPEEQAEFVNNFLRGFTTNRINLSKPSHTKERKVDYVTPENVQYYEDSMQALMSYVTNFRMVIEAKKLFGKSEKDTEENIGHYVLSLVKDGTIQKEQEDEVKKILRAVVVPTSTTGAVTWAKNASYIYLMGSPISAITQIQDLAFSLWKNGYYRTGKSALKSLLGMQELKKEDIGIDNILQEFQDNSRSSDAVRKTFKAIGLEFMDNFGKEVYMDASLNRLRKLNKKNDSKFNQMLEDAFGDQATQVKKDLESKTNSENVKYLIFSELSDVQPISLAEMPVGYLRGGNGRVFYMLKTYTIKQLDIYRREIFDEVTSGDYKRTVNGLSNLVRVTTALMLMGFGSDAIKDFLLGREITLDDLVVDNIVKLFGISKFQIYKSRRDGIMNTVWQTLFVPPVGTPIDDIYKDISQIYQGKKEVKDAEVLGRVPIVGKFYYWWAGGGSEKN